MEPVKNEIIMLLLITVAALFLMPELTARFSGSHSMEINTTTKVQ
ncbi:MAG: hypothetical protein ACE5J5_06955 [Candidatus Hydrothermarchaeales archaeon]